MGMGEPLLNFDNLAKAIKLLNHEVGIGARRMTVSTVGIVQGIRKLAQLGMQVNLGGFPSRSQRRTSQQTHPSKIASDR
jgi:23S rRNA (adenine2503-C2)-methyltransferase